MVNWKRFRRAAAIVGLTLALGLTAGCGGDKQDAAKNSYNIGVVQLVEHGALDAANKGFVEGLAAKGYKDNVKFDQQNAQADQSNLQNIAQRFINNKVDLICAIATPAAQTVANATSTIPIVATAVTDYEEAKLVKTNAKPGTNVTGTTDMNPIEQQIDLLLRFVPDAKAIGLIYCSSEVNSQKQAAIMKAYTEAKGIKVIEATVSTVNDIQQAAQSIVSDVDGIYVPTDNILASAMPTLASITIPAKLPVVAGEENMTKAGGIATVGIDYYKLGYQTGEMAADILAGKAKPADMAIQSQSTMAVTVNEEYAKAIGMEIPADLKQQAKK